MKHWNFKIPKNKTSLDLSNFRPLGWKRHKFWHTWKIGCVFCILLQVILSNYSWSLTNTSYPCCHVTIHSFQLLKHRKATLVPSGSPSVIRPQTPVDTFYKHSQLPLIPLKNNPGLQHQQVINPTECTKNHSRKREILPGSYPKYLEIVTWALINPQKTVI